MDDEQTTNLSKILPTTYARVAAQALNANDKIFQNLITNMTMPKHGLDDNAITYIMSSLSAMDHNSHPGEREGRVVCPMVRTRHFGMAHGIGRSGDLNEIQPKACGSSVMNHITNGMITKLLRHLGAKKTESAMVMPVATGMAIMLTFTSLLRKRPNAKYVVWLRMDQKSALRASRSLGLSLIIVEGKHKNNEIVTDLNMLDYVLSHVSTCHDVDDDDDDKVAMKYCVYCRPLVVLPRELQTRVALLCSKYNVPHVINNAYGVQATKTMASINDAMCRGRVDVYIQSTDKNFMVPVGGSIIASNNAETVYYEVGRASSSPIIDLFITLLYLGEEGYDRLLTERASRLEALRQSMLSLSDLGCELLDTKKNPISLAVHLKGIDRAEVTDIGARLYIRDISGCRVLSGNDTFKFDVPAFVFVGDDGDRQLTPVTSLTGWGCHISSYSHLPYFNVAASIGIGDDDIDKFAVRFRKVMTDRMNK